MVRTQLFLGEAIHERLRSLTRKQGRTVSALVREVLEAAFGNRAQDERERTLKAIEGLWRGRSDIAATREYVRGLRRNTRRSGTRKR